VAECCTQLLLLFLAAYDVEFCFVVVVKGGGGDTTPGGLVERSTAVFSLRSAATGTF
jgi:hypothetical protein